MSGTNKQSGGLIGFLVRTLLVVGLLLTLAGAYVAFFILPEEFPERQVFEETAALPAKYGDQPSVFSSTTTVTSATPSELDLKPLDWRTMAHIEKADTPNPDIVITATDLNDNLLPVDYFTAAIVLASDDKQILPGIGFSEEEPGRFVARGVTLPDNGDWEIRATVRRGMQTMLIGQKIQPLLPFKPREAAPAGGTDKKSP